MTIGRICSRVTHLADAHERARDAARRMKQENVGTLVVVDGQQRPIGILTDRDLALRLVAEGHDPAQVTVAEVMTAHPRTAPEDLPIEDALTRMRGFGVRRLPVVDAQGKLVGILSADDVLELVAEELGSIGRILGWSHRGIGLPVERPAAPERAASPPRKASGTRGAAKTATSKAKAVAGKKR
ncbi:MAG: CBS domain-containing protein [Planctomycetes bacterium]|nr:CBS domain-containing protein [Planctomycetota bacterium]